MTGRKYGGAEGDRTLDLRIANANDRTPQVVDSNSDGSVSNPLRSVDTCWRVRALLDRLALFLLSLIPERVKRWSERVWHWIKLPFIFVALILLALVGLMLAGGA